MNLLNGEFVTIVALHHDKSLSFSVSAIRHMTSAGSRINSDFICSLASFMLVESEGSDYGA
jgi:hypothetical protein